MRRALFASILFGRVGSSPLWPTTAGHSILEFTWYTITNFQMSPAGRDSWGPDQCKNDRDGTVDQRRAPANYRQRTWPLRCKARADKIGRVCIVRNVEVN